jgi:Tfp pilus assembly protein PilF
MTKISVSDHLSALFRELFGLLQRPEMIAGHILETFNDWRKSRNWWQFFVGLPVLIGSGFIFSTVLFAAFRNSSSVVHDAFVEADKRIPQTEIEKLAFDEHYIRTKIRERPDPDLQVDEDADDGYGLKRSTLKLNHELVTSDKFLGVDVLLHRALWAKPDSSQAKYRLALITSINSKIDEPLAKANALMTELASKENDANAQAHAWLAAVLLGKNSNNEPIELAELEKHLAIASKWKSVDAELLRYYSEVCIKNGNLDKALIIAKQAAESRVERNLDYAKICKALGPKHQTEMFRAAAAAEAAFQMKRGTAAETDFDRLCLAEVLIIQDRLDAAIEVLKERLDDPSDDHKRIRLGLAGLYVDAFIKANEETFKKIPLRTTSSGAKSADANAPMTRIPSVEWDFLQQAAKLDNDNPTIGEVIAIYFRKYDILLPTDLKEVLTYQLNSDIASTIARQALADLYVLNNNIPRARSEWEKILRIDPNFIEALNNLAIFLSRESPPQIERALEYSTRAYRLQPNNAEIADTHGEVLMVAQQYVDAIALLERAIRLDPTRINSRKRLMECYLRLGMNEMAIEQDGRIRDMEAQREETRRLELEAAKLAIEKEKEEQAMSLDRPVPDKKEDSPKEDSPKEGSPKKDDTKEGNAKKDNPAKSKNSR